jgi:hypothetical protein
MIWLAWAGTRFARKRFFPDQAEKGGSNKGGIERSSSIGQNP